MAAAQVALGDEIEHARLCFDLASAYAGAAIGPSSLDLQGILADTGLHATVTAAIHEACIGETLAAAEACEALAEATDPAVRQVLTKIEGLREEAAPHADAVDPMTATLAAHGLSPEHRRQAARRAALEQVVVPLSRALLSEEASRSGAAHGMTGRHAARISARAGSALPLG